MSTWFDQSNNANKLRQSYLKGFLDISGGGILVRSDNSLNFYKSDSAAIPNFALDATKIRVPNYPADADGRKRNSTVTNVIPQVAGAINTQYVDISSAQLSYLYGLNENVQATIDEFHSYKTAQSSSATIAELTSTNANIANDATIGGKLFVGGDASVGGNLSVAKNVYVGGNLVVAENQVVNMDLYVKGNCHLDGDVFIGKDLRIYNANLYVNKNFTASGEILIQGDSYFNQKAFIVNDVSMGGKLTLLGDASFNSKLRVSGDASLNSNLSVHGTIYCDKIVIGTDLSDNGTMKIGQKLTAGSDVEIAGKLDVAGNTALVGKLDVTGATGLTTLTTSGAATLESLAVTNNATVGGSLTVTGGINLSTASTSGLATLNSASVTTTLGVTGDATLGAKLDLTGAAKLLSTLSTTGDASFNSNLYVTGDASLNAHTSVRDISAGILQTGRLIIEDNYSNNANVPNTIRTTAGNIRISPNLATDWTVITSNLQVDGSINFTGAMIRTDTIVKVTEAFDVSNSGSRTALVVSQYAPSKNIASFDRGDEADPVFTVGRDNSVGINITSGNLNANWHLDVSGATRISKDLQVNGDVSFTKELSVSGNVLISKDLSVTKTVSISETLDVSGASVFHSTAEIKGNVLLRSHLKMDANKFIDQVAGESW
jgi:UDP-3-O-[3-hydroxymyristoyl] glucosamine N-acyltransferase